MSESMPQSNPEYMAHHPDVVQDVEFAHDIANATNHDRSNAADARRMVSLLKGEVSPEDQELSAVVYGPARESAELSLGSVSTYSCFSTPKSIEGTQEYFKKQAVEMTEASMAYTADEPADQTEARMIHEASSK